MVSRMCAVQGDRASQGFSQDKRGFEGTRGPFIVQIRPQMLPYKFISFRVLHPSIHARPNLEGHFLLLWPSSRLQTNFINVNRRVDNHDRTHSSYKAIWLDYQSFYDKAGFRFSWVLR